MELLYGAKIKGYNKAPINDIKRAFDIIERAQLKIQIGQTCNTDTELTNILINILNIYEMINYDICGKII